MQTPEPVLMDFGSFSLVSPDGKHRIPPDLWPTLALAIAAPANDVRARLVVELDETLAQRAEAAREASAERRRQTLDQSLHVARLGAFDRDPATLVALDAKTTQAARFLANAVQLEADSPKKNRTAIKTLRKNARRVRDEIAVILGAELRQISEWGEARGPILRAEARGELVHVREVEAAEVATDEYGARIIEQTGPRRGEPALVYSRATRVEVLYGIKHAYRAGYLNQRGTSAEMLRQVGLDYGTAYVTAEESIQGANLESTGGGGDGRPKAPQAKRQEASNTLSIMRRTLTDAQRKMLDEVCARDTKLRDAGRIHRHDFPVARRLLVTALIAADAALSEAREKDLAGKAWAKRSAADLAAVTAALRRVRA